MNDRIAELLEDLNTREMRRYRASRRDLYEKLERAGECQLFCVWEDSTMV
jgi:hypothetical protein